MFRVVSEFSISIQILIPEIREPSILTVLLLAGIRDTCGEPKHLLFFKALEINKTQFLIYKFIHMPILCQVTCL
jgi:hypothetical protein